MNNQQRLEDIQQRLDKLAELTQRLDRIIELLENKNKSCEPMTTFIPASNKASDKFIKEREMEIFQMLDKK